MAIRIAVWIQGLFSGFVTVGRYGKWYHNRLCCATLQCRACTGRHRHSNNDVITSPAHDRRALAEVCTVSVLLISKCVFTRQRVASVGLCDAAAGDEMRLGERDEEMLTNIRAVVNALHSQNDSRVTQRPLATAPYGHAAAAAAAVRCNSFEH